MKVSIGIIGGSGLYEIEGIEVVDRIKVDTPFGMPSGDYEIAEIGGRRVAFLPRHGLGHRKVPTFVNYRANVYGFKVLGVERLISFSAVGSLKENINPMDLVIPDQFFDYTKSRKSTFFEDGIAAHVEFAEPVCPSLGKELLETCRSLDATAHEGGCYVCIEGPQFSTKAESAFFRSLDMTVIGMTNVTEAKLAREAELCFATVALVTDYDCWYEGESVSVDMVIGRLKRNAETAARIIKSVVPVLAERPGCRCGSSLEGAFITPVDAIPPDIKARLGPVIGKYMPERTKEEKEEEQA
ncbi:S-methyl-5'-thioadenosine phosphorylase [Acidobacteriota bacterium]